MSAPQAPAESPAHTNALIHETSPYLLQHAHNPVDWHAWLPETIELARKADKPIFLSVGYSTCYWCHVMERESFESDKIAAIMNEHFINIKVDREERPDVDDIYMSAVQAMSGQGGWPMSVFLDPHTLRPFYGGTYFPAEPMYGRQSFPQLLEAIANAWSTQRQQVNEQAARVAEAVTQQELSGAKPQAVGRQQVDQAIELLNRIYDREHGGFGRAPKFPQPVFLELLIGAAWDNDQARAMLLHTLDRMALGGMYDQIGGGFHRYSTDERWLVPHFEKMLYDQGQLVSVYAEAYERTKDEFYAEVVRETLNYVLREMTAPEGSFFSAQDAEVDAREGLNYLWLPDQVATSLRGAGLENDIDFTLQAYGFTQGTNFRDPHHPEDGPKNVVFLVDRPDALAKSLGMPLEHFNERLARVNAALLETRSKRKQPRTDDKVLAGWNGLMIAAFADGGRAMHDDTYTGAAKRAVEFVLERIRRPDGGLLRTWRDGRAKIDGFLEDYALMIRGLLALHRATGEAWHLHKAVELYDLARRDFWDEARGGFFDTLADRPDLFIRTRGSYDGAVPSGNGVMALNLIELHRRTGDRRFRDDARALIASLSGAIAENPLSTALATLALHHLGEVGAEAEATMRTDEASKPATASDPVTITAVPSTIEVGGGDAAEVQITLTIAPGYHINAHRPGLPNLVALQLHLENVGGVELDTIYPEGERYGEGIQVHQRQARIKAMLRQIGAVTGQPRLMITYQPCTDQACLKPRTVEIPLRIMAPNR